MEEPWKIADRYHQRTKHHFDRYARSLGYLDWATQPDPFRRFEGAPLFPLPFSRGDSAAAYDDLFLAGQISPQPVNLNTLAALFEFSLAISAWKEFKGSRWALRINPSSGNLHPTEGYLVVGAGTGLHDRPAVYHYAPKEHALERRAELSEADWKQWMRPFPPGTFLAGLTSIHWREAWKYGERAYRYCQHDAGHALAALSLSAAIQGWGARALPLVSDPRINNLLGLDREPDFDGTEREHPDLLLAIVPRSVLTGKPSPDDSPQSAALDPEVLTVISEGAWTGRANLLSASHVDWPIIDEVAEACGKHEADGPSSFDSESPSADPLSFSPRRLPATRIIRQRRSAVDFDGSTSMSAEQFFLMMDRAMPRYDHPPWTALGPPTCMHLALFVHRVMGLEPGLYFLVRTPRVQGQLRQAMNPKFAWEKPADCPSSIPLYGLAAGDVRAIASSVSCHQDIAGESCFSLGMIAEFQGPLQRYGAWFYRRLFWETGVIGQILYLEAEAAGLRATGIGCFFDDAVHQLLGFKDTTFQSLYHFTVGGPIEDSRLTTLPPYPPDLRG